MRLFLILTIYCRLFASSFTDISPSSPEEILSLTSDPLVEGYVSPASGQICISENDLHIKAAQDLILKRIYVTPKIFGRYQDEDIWDLPILGSQLRELQDRGWIVNPHIEAGFKDNSKFFRIRDPQGFVLEYELFGNKGVLKSTFGCSNLIDDQACSTADIRNIELVVENEQAIATCPGGTQRVYIKNESNYRLDREILPNGKIIFYEYNKNDLSKIFSADRSKKYIYASIAKMKQNRYQGSDGTEANLVYNHKEVKYKIKSSNLTSKLHLDILTSAVTKNYANTAQYDERFLLSSYDAKEYPISCSYDKLKGIPVRVRSFSTPSGDTSFSYDIAIPGEKGGSTIATHPDGAQTIYRYNKILLLEAIENWLEGKLINKKCYKYDETQHIKSIQTISGDGEILTTKRFECDAAGNPLVEELEGDTGVYKIRRKFDKNRLVFEERDNGLQVENTYYGDTWLVTSKTLYEFGKKLRRTNYYYDDALNLYKEEEEGKTRTIYFLYQSGPHLHRVEQELKQDWEGNLIHKIHYIYDQWGNTQEEKHYGSHGNLAFTVHRKYNKKGELLEETNPLGNRAIYRYDSRGRCDYEEPVSNGLIIKRAFDAKGRLTVLEEGSHKTVFDYNSSDEVAQKTDYLGYTTKYYYHPVHGKPELIEEPEAKTQIKYDAFGRAVKILDACGAVTKKKYTSFGDVKSIIDPDGGEAMSTYSPNGLLIIHKDPDGLHTTYTYDALDRVIEKKVGSFVTVFEYDGYDLLNILDPEGYKTEYNYDFTGHKIEEKRSSRVIRYGYDALGFLAWEERGSRRIEYTNDALGRVVHKSIDNILNTRWTYDAGGNISSVDQGGLTFFEFDEHNRLSKKVSPEGNVTKVDYQIGPQLLIKIITDPLGVVTTETYNVKGQLLTKEVDGLTVENLAYDSMFRPLSQDHLAFSYTLNGEKKWMNEAGLRSTYWSYTPGARISSKQKPDGTFLIHDYDENWRLRKIGNREFQYDALNRIIGGTNFKRKLDAFGNIKREEWSNGLWIENEYDEWDRITQITLPDQSRIIYDYQGPLLKKVTRLDKRGKQIYTHVYDQYDAKGNPTSESGLFPINSSYDKSGRKISMKTPYLTEEVEYDPRGNLVSNGQISYTYDSLSQMTSQSNSFSAEYDQHYNLVSLNNNRFDLDELNQLKSFSYDPNGNLQRSQFIYDEFDQLIQAEGEKYIYDALGRRIQKGDICFLYLGDEEIGAFKNNKPKELKVSGLSPVSIEIDQKPYFPIPDVQGIIRFLIDKKFDCYAKNDCDAFGKDLTDAIPYAYCGKRYDSQTGLVYFGKRFYDPNLHRWLTPDPIGPFDHSNLYQYVFNNPFRYRDLNGENIFGFLCGIGQIVLGGTLIVTGTALEIATCGAYTIGFGLQTEAGLALMASGCALSVYHAQDISVEKRNRAAGPDPRAQGNPHTTIEVPGAAGQYTTYNDDGSFKQYRGSGRDHGNIPRPNVKENKIDNSPKGKIPGTPTVRPARTDEIPRGK